VAPRGRKPPPERSALVAGDLVAAAARTRRPGRVDQESVVMLAKVGKVLAAVPAWIIAFAAVS